METLLYDLLISLLVSFGFFSQTYFEQKRARTSFSQMTEAITKNQQTISADLSTLQKQVDSLYAQNQVLQTSLSACEGTILKHRELLIRMANRVKQKQH
jgi:DnaJ-domain-containing protein 1